MIKHYDLLVVDEVHTALSPIRRRVFNNITRSQLLCLTATPPEDKDYFDYLATVAPIVYTKTLSDVVGQDIVADYQIFNLEVSFSRKDGAKYNSFNRLFIDSQVQIGIEKNKRQDLKSTPIFDIAKEYSGISRVQLNEITNEREREKTAILVRLAKSYWSAMTMRKWVCYNSTNKIATVLDILRNNPDKKWIIFGKSIKFAEQMHRSIPNSLLYHSKLKSDERESVLRRFNDSTKVLVAVDALNAGLNVPEVDGAICVSGVSTELVTIQQIGRILRFRPGKKAVFINLYTKESVEETWVRNKTKNFKHIWIKSVNQIKYA